MAIFPGTPGDDVLQGTDGDDWLYGFARADTLDGGAGAVALIDRLTHHAEILLIEGQSYRRR